MLVFLASECAWNKQCKHVGVRWISSLALQQEKPLQWWLQFLGDFHFHFDHSDSVRGAHQLMLENTNWRLASFEPFLTNDVAWREYQVPSKTVEWTKWGNWIVEVLCSGNTFFKWLPPCLPRLLAAHISVAPWCLSATADTWSSPLLKISCMELIWSLAFKIALLNLSLQFEKLDFEKKKTK